MSWLSDDDILKDISLYANSNVSKHKQPPPPTVLEYQARLCQSRNPGIYDVPINQEEGLTLVNTGRGRDCFQTYRPGRSVPTASNVNDEDIIKRKLKEVNGLGFSNEVIEANYRKTNKEIITKSPRKSPIIISSDDDQYSDATSDIRGSTISPLSTTKTCSPMRSSSSLSSSSANTSTDKDEVYVPDPPLSKLLALGKKRPAKTKQTHVKMKESLSSDESDKWWNFNDFSQAKYHKDKDAFNITSEDDFPRL